MIRVRWYKVISDLWSHRTRTLIVSLAVAVGVYAVGAIMATQTLMLREFHSDRNDAQLAEAILYTQPFDAELAERVQEEIPGVIAAEGRESLRARVPVDGETRYGIEIVAIDDFATMRVDSYPFIEGRWPDAKNEIMLEHMGLALLGVAIGDTITIELPDDTQKHFVVTGVMHDPTYPSPEITGFTTAAVTPAGMEYLGGLPLFTELRLRLDDAVVASQGAQGIVDAVQDRIEKSGRTVVGRTIIGKSIIESIVNTAVMILSFFGWIILLLSAFLVINTISALIAQQVNQIGIMKLVGAGRGEMVAMYLTLVLVYGILAFSIAIPLAVLTAQYLMTDLIAPLVNLRPESLALPWWLYAMMVAIGVLIPVLAGVLPVWQGTRITTYAALNELGMQTGTAAGGFFERMLARLPKRWLQRPLVLAVRNTLRHKGRLLRTMIVMILGTSLFIAVISVRVSVDTTQADFLRYHQYDVQVQFQEAHRIARLEQAALTVPGVVRVEARTFGSASRTRPDGVESNRYQVIGVPEGSTMIDPIVQAGRWLRPDDEYAVVINATVAQDEPDVQVGDTIVLKMNDRERTWQVVGIVGADAQGPKIFMNRTVFGYENRLPNRANSVQVLTETHDLLGQKTMESTLLRHFEKLGYAVLTTRTTQTLNSQNGLMFDIIVGFLILNAVLLGLVGSLGLSTTMGINMLERIREIGVLRAIGASNSAIRRIVLLEGLVIATLSWIIGFALSYPVAQVMSEQIGVALLDTPLSFTYALPAAIIWFFVLLLLAVAASLGPARNAVRLTIREVLAYE
ncbi:MAG TPA: ABC transporter permease [Chloroflexi bacterium]|nr:ABC transporter permease [Chloroflexota bacterium]HHW87828.1 ABC transporter permease [Chloroflexota bacterium]